MSTAPTEGSSSTDGSNSLAEAIRDYRWLFLLVVFELILGVTAIGLEALSSDTPGENTIYEVVAGMIGGWMVILALTAVVLFVIVRGLDMMEDVDDHYLDYLES